MSQIQKLKDVGEVSKQLRSQKIPYSGEISNSLPQGNLDSYISPAKNIKTSGYISDYDASNKYQITEQDFENLLKIDQFRQKSSSSVYNTCVAEENKQSGSSAHQLLYQIKNQDETELKRSLLKAQIHLQRSKLNEKLRLESQTSNISHNDNTKKNKYDFQYPKNLPNSARGDVPSSQNSLSANQSDQTSKTSEQHMPINCMIQKRHQCNFSQNIINHNPLSQRSNQKEKGGSKNMNSSNENDNGSISPQKWNEKYPDFLRRKDYYTITHQFKGNNKSLQGEEDLIYLKNSKAYLSAMKALQEKIKQLEHQIIKEIEKRDNAERKAESSLKVCEENMMLMDKEKNEYTLEKQKYSYSIQQQAQLVNQQDKLIEELKAQVHDLKKECERLREIGSEQKKLMEDQLNLSVNMQRSLQEDNNILKEQISLKSQQQLTFEYTLKEQKEQQFKEMQDAITKLEVEQQNRLSETLKEYKNKVGEVERQLEDLRRINTNLEQKLQSEINKANFKKQQEEDEQIIKKNGTIQTIEDNKINEEQLEKYKHQELSYVNEISALKSAIHYQNIKNNNNNNNKISQYSNLINIDTSNLAKNINPLYQNQQDQVISVFNQADPLNQNTSFFQVPYTFSYHQGQCPNNIQMARSSQVFVQSPLSIEGYSGYQNQVNNCINNQTNKNYFNQQSQQQVETMINNQQYNQILQLQQPNQIQPNQSSEEERNILENQFHKLNQNGQIPSLSLKQNELTFKENPQSFLAMTQQSLLSPIAGKSPSFGPIQFGNNQRQSIEISNNNQEKIQNLFGYAKDDKLSEKTLMSQNKMKRGESLKQSFFKTNDVKSLQNDKQILNKQNKLAQTAEYSSKLEDSKEVWNLNSLYTSKPLAESQKESSELTKSILAVEQEIELLNSEYTKLFQSSKKEEHSQKKGEIRKQLLAISCKTKELHQNLYTLKKKEKFIAQQECFRSLYSIQNPNELSNVPGLSTTTSQENQQKM